MKYIRFQTTEIDEESTKPLGIFQVAHKLCRSGDMYDYEEEYLKELLEWFDNELDEPNKFSRKNNALTYRGISWYKHDAKEHLEKMYEVKRILEDNEIFIEMKMTDNPGFIVYEDEFQIVAEPFKESL